MVDQITFRSSSQNVVGLLDHWKPVPGYEGRYEVSCTGKIRNTRSLRILRHTGNSRYPQVRLRTTEGVKKYYVHKLVMRVFIGPWQCEEAVTRIDGWHLNNRVSNLKYSTRTCRQRIVLNAISAFFEENDFGPRSIDIAEDTGLPLYSVTEVMAALECKGIIMRVKDDLGGRCGKRIIGLFAPEDHGVWDERRMKF